MTDAERNLLITVARILRVRIKEEIFDPSGNNKSDYQALMAALAPFDALPVHGGNFAQSKSER